MGPGRASLVLSHLRPPSSVEGFIITDDPARIRDPALDVLLEDVLVLDRYALRRYDSARILYAGSALPSPGAERSDYEYAFVQAHVDLSVRVERFRRVLEGRNVATLAVPDLVTPDTWAAAFEARQSGIAVERYASGQRGLVSTGEQKHSLARWVLSITSPFLLSLFRRRPIRILTTDLGLLDSIVPNMLERPGVLSPGLGVGQRVARQPGTYAWLVHKPPRPQASLGAAETIEEAATLLAAHAGAVWESIQSTARRLFAEGSVDVLVVAEDKAPINHGLVRLATEADLPSLVVQHGIAGHPIGMLPLRASHFAAWGPAETQWLVARGMPQASIVETGDPRYDQVLRHRGEYARNGRAQAAVLGVLSPAPLAVYFSQPLMGRAQAFRMVLEATKGLTVRVVAKVHPAEDATLYRGLAARSGGSVPVVTGAAAPLLCAADVVLTQNSGLAVVAAQLAIPVILLDPIVLQDVDVYDARWPRAIDAASLRLQLESALQKSYDVNKIRALGEEYGGPADGRAGERVARFIEGLVRGHA